MSQSAGVIAIDGQVAAGKTAAGRALARRLGCPYLDTGIMYRAVAWLARDKGVDVTDTDALGQLAVDNPVQFKEADYGVVVMEDGLELSGELRTPDIDRLAAQVARAAPVRRELVRQQRVIAAGAGSIVMVGRDIGTVVLPEADLKVYMRASPEVRAGRRYAEMREQGQDADFEQVLADAKARDESDSRTARYYHHAVLDDTTPPDNGDDTLAAAPPLIQAADALAVNTDDRSVEQVVDYILEKLAARLGQS